MSLQRQPVEVPIYAGTTDEKHDFVAVGPGNAAVENGRFLSDGAISKRFGHELPPTLSAVSPNANNEGGAHTIIETGGRLGALLHDGAFAHDEVRNAWAQMGRIGPRPSQARTDPHVRGNNNLRHADMAVAAVAGRTVLLTVWHDTEEDAVYYSFHELPSDGRPAVPVFPPTKVTGSLARFPKCAASGTRFAIVGTDSGQTAVFGTTIDASSSYVMPASTSVHTNCDQISSTLLEFFANGSSFWIVTGHFGQTVIYRRKGSDFTADGNATLTKGNARAAALVGANVIIAHTDGNVSRIISDLSAGGTTAGPFLTPQATTAVHCATVVQADSSGRYYVAWSGDGSSVPGAGGLGNFGLDIAYFDSSHTGISQTALGGVRLGGRACWDGSTAGPLFPLINRQSESANYTAAPPLSAFFSGYVGRPCLTDKNGTAWLRIAPVAAYGIDVADLYQAYFLNEEFYPAGTVRNHLPSMQAVAAGRFAMPFTVYTSTAVGLTKRHVDLLRLETVGSASLRTVSAQGVRVCSGGIVSSVDGVVSTELSPPPPIYIDASTNDTAYSYGASDPRPAGAGGGTLAVSFAFKWRDAAGNVHRSFVNEAQSLSWVNLSSGTWYARRWVFPRPWPIALTQGASPLQYQVELYQSAGDGVVPGDPRYLTAEATPKEHPTLLGCDYIVPVFPAVATGAPHEIPVSNFPTAALASGGYTPCWQDTTPAEFIHVPPPPMVDLCSTQDRVWGLSAEGGRLEVWPSKILTDGYAPEFAPDLVRRVPAEGGEGRALAALDDKVVVFKERNIYVLFGSPGTNTGQRATLQTARLVSGDVGCSNARSVVEGPFGVAFQASSDALSARGGIHVIDRGMAVSFVGMPAKDISAGVTFESATLVPAEKEARWVMPSGDVLVWNYDVNRWHVHKDRARFSSCLRRGRFASLYTSAVSRVDQSGWADDAITNVSTHGLGLTTNWIKLAGLQGFVRVWTATFLLRWWSGDLTIDMATDYNESWTSPITRTWTQAELSLLAVNGAGSRVQISWHLPVQKLEAIRFRLTETATPFFIGQTEFSRAGRGMDVVGLTLEAGIKRGSYRRAMSATSRK